MKIVINDTKITIAELEKDMFFDLFLLLCSEDVVLNEGSKTIREAMEDQLEFWGIDIEAEKKRRLVKELPF